MRIKVVFEIGHIAQLKNKASPEGFTHDWELFVRGADGNNISRFVDKIVFNLHDSFPKPCRVYKEPPYVLKESGYASFNLPIDIYLRAGPKDDPKRIAVTYDLDISKTTVQKHPLTITNPSSEFRHKLLEGGGIMINTDGHSNDERTYLQPDSTTKPRPTSSSSTSGTSKKHKVKSDDLKPTSTFENLFGSPIFNSKNSPDPKLSNSSSSSSKLPTNSGSKNPSQKPTKERSSEKSGKEKRDKKDKSGSTPKEGSKETSAKKTTDEKNERREEKRKEKSSTKDRDRSKEKSLKRPPSPKPTSRSPKRSASPARASSSNSNRHESTKYDDKLSSSNSGKKSKKDKRDKSKERDRSSGDKSKESKHQMQQTKQKDDKSNVKPTEKLNGSSKKEENETKERDKSSKYRFDKPPSPLDVPNKIPTPTDTKKSHDKDERKHKHKKKDKNKEKDRKKTKSKDISDESPSSRKRTNAQTPTQAIRQPNNKSNAMTVSIPPPNRLSDKSSSEFEDDDFGDRTSPKPLTDKVTSTIDNQTIDPIDTIPDIVTPRSNHIDSPKKHSDKLSGKKGKEPKSNASSASKDDKKKKRKSKIDKQKHDDATTTSNKRKTQSPIVNDEPPAKFHKKDDEKMPKIKDENPNPNDSIKLLPGRTPPVPPHLSASPSTQKLYHQSPDSSKQVNMKRSADYALSVQSKVPHISSPTTTSSSSPSSSDNESESVVPVSVPVSAPLPPPPSPSDKQYIAQLRALQQKIMTLQDNDELQKVVEMIAATGCYEITNKTFDFDLCAIDRTTVQRLQERLG